jgi:signal transduction histidine kinase
MSGTPLVPRLVIPLDRRPSVAAMNHSIVVRALYRTALRIALVSVAGGIVSFCVNDASIKASVRRQLVTSTEQKLQRESLQFKEIKSLQNNFLADFSAAYADPRERATLARDFDLVFHRHEDGSYTQRPGLFEGEALPDGRRFPQMSATYAPQMPPDADIKARFMLSYLLSYKYGSSMKGRLFNFYGVVPEKGFPIFQANDIAKIFTYSGPDALKLETYEFYERGFGSARNDAIFTRMYWDASNHAWMTTVATPDVADASGRHKILACVDVLLDQLMQRTAAPLLPGSRSTIFQVDEGGTLIFHADHVAAIEHSEGHASIRSLGLKDDLPLLEASHAARPGEVALIETPAEIVALGVIPETQWALAVRYPRALMRPAILLNLAVVGGLGLVMLVVELLIFRSILVQQVARPLLSLTLAMRRLGLDLQATDQSGLPTQAQDEIGGVAREFAAMAARVHDACEQLENKVQARTAELEASRQALRELGEYNAMALEDERKRISRELHDEMGQQLAALRMEVSVMRRRAGAAQSGPDGPHDMLLDRVDRLIASLRALVSQLRPPALDGGLNAAIEWQGTEFTRDTGVPCRLDLDPAANGLPPDAATMVFRIVQESLTNVRRHARPTQVALSLMPETDGWALTIADDGVGFNTECKHRRGYGLLSMEERARLLGGELQVESAPGKGTTVRLRLDAGRINALYTRPV